MESVLPALGITPTIAGVRQFYKLSTWLGKKSYDITKMATGGSGTRELKTGIVRKGVTGSGVSPLVGSNKVVVGSAKKLSENKSMAAPTTPPRTPKSKKRKSKDKKDGSKKKSKTDKKPVYKPKKFKAKGFSIGKAAGKFKKSKKRPLTLVTAAQNGYVVSKDITGTVADPQCVYMYHSTYDLNMITRGIIAAMLRALFKKAGIDIVNENTELPLADAANSEGYKILYNDRNPITQLYNPVYTYAINDNTTFRSMLDDMSQYSGNSIYQRLIDYMVNNNNANVPCTITLAVKDNSEVNVVSPWRTHTHLSLENERIVMMCKSQITIQNRTKGSAATATDYSDQRVDNQPLKGKLYEFRNGDPRVRQAQKVGDGITDQYEFLYNSGATAGVRSFGQLHIPNDYMDSPPLGKFWKNVKKTTLVAIEPGDIKTAEIEVKYDLPIPELINRFRVVDQGDHKNTAIYTGLKSHKSQIVALEELLKTPADNFITCVYQIRQTVASYCYAKKNKALLRTQHFSSVVDQWVPPS